MRSRAWRCALALVLAIAWIAFGQERERTSVDDPQHDVTLPNGKSQRAEILKAEREQNIKDAAQLVDLSKELQQEIEKNESYVLSLGTLKKTDEIEKVVKRIRGHLRHY
jgi:cell division septation protein DedD